MSRFVLLVSVLVSLAASLQAATNALAGPSRAVATTNTAATNQSGVASSATSRPPQDLKTVPKKEDLEYWQETMLYGTDQQKESVLKTMQAVQHLEEPLARCGIADLSERSDRGLLDGEGLIGQMLEDVGQDAGILETGQGSDGRADRVRLSGIGQGPNQGAEGSGDPPVVEDLDQLELDRALGLVGESRQKDVIYLFGLDGLHGFEDGILLLLGPVEHSFLPVFKIFFFGNSLQVLRGAVGGAGNNAGLVGGLGTGGCL